MSVIHILLTISILVALVFFITFMVAVRSEQFNHAYIPSVRVLFEEGLCSPFVVVF